jgi:hypothetical protein
MLIRKLAGRMAIAALGLLALGSASASASTHLRLDPGNMPFAGSTTVTNTTSGPMVWTTGVGNLSCSASRFDADVNAHTSATTIGGSLTGLTFTSCTDSIPLLNFTGCHRHGATLPTVTINGSAGTVAITDLIVRCTFQGSTSACYLTAASAAGTYNNAASTLTYVNVPVAVITTPTTDAIAPGACGTSGSWTFAFTHIVQGGTNRTVTVLP